MSRWANKYVIGLTGNIAVGKSVVRQMLQHLGAYTIDADGLAHQAMSPGAPVYQPIVDTFGQVILNPDKTINRALLGSMVFSSPALLEKLEAITHPIIGQAINTLISRAKQPIIVIEAIKLIEGELGKGVDEIWVVNASPKTQYQRLLSKRKMSEEAAKQRILAQNAQRDKLKSATTVINNDGNVEETWKQVQSNWGRIKTKLAPPKPATQATAPKPPTPQTVAPQTPTPSPTQPAPVAQKTAPQTAQPAPAPTYTATDTGEVPIIVDATGIAVRRGMPNHAEVIAQFINKETGKGVGRMDVIMAFGQKSYLLAEFGGKTAGVIGWQVENLITRVDELYVEETPNKERVIYALVQAIEDASRELQSEVSFVFLPRGTSQERIKPFLNAGYNAITISEIKIPAWREAAQELFTDGATILTKRLREDRVLKPI